MFTDFKTKSVKVADGNGYDADCFLFDALIHSEFAGGNYVENK
jgi:hypothetical protein